MIAQYLRMLNRRGGRVTRESDLEVDITRILSGEVAITIVPVAGVGTAQ